AAVLRRGRRRCAAVDLEGGRRRHAGCGQRGTRGCADRNDDQREADHVVSLERRSHSAMTGTRTILTVLVTVAAATLLFWAVLHQISAVWLDVALRPEVKKALEQSLDDQKALRVHDPAQRALYRKRFDETHRLLNRIEVLRLNRESMLRRFELALIAVFVL